MLHCLEGVGLVTSEEVIVLRPGTTVWPLPNQRHWHGAAPDRFMAHLAMSGTIALAEGEEAVSWQEHVDDTDHLAAASVLDPTTRSLTLTTPLLEPDERI